MTLSNPSSKYRDDFIKVFESGGDVSKFLLARPETPLSVKSRIGYLESHKSGSQLQSLLLIALASVLGVTLFMWAYEAIKKGEARFGIKHIRLTDPSKGHANVPVFLGMLAVNGASLYFKWANIVSIPIHASAIILSFAWLFCKDNLLRDQIWKIWKWATVGAYAVTAVVKVGPKIWAVVKGKFKDADGKDPKADDEGKPVNWLALGGAGLMTFFKLKNHTDSDPEKWGDTGNGNGNNHNNQIQTAGMLEYAKWGFVASAVFALGYMVYQRVARTR